MSVIPPATGPSPSIWRPGARQSSVEFGSSDRATKSHEKSPFPLLLLIKCTSTAPSPSKSWAMLNFSDLTAVRSGTGAVSCCAPSGDDVITTVSPAHTWPAIWRPSPRHFRRFWRCRARHRRPDSQVWIPFKECLHLRYSPIYCTVCKNNFAKFFKEFSRKSRGVFKKFVFFQWSSQLGRKNGLWCWMRWVAK